METITLEQIKKNLAEEYAKYCSDYWYAVYLRRNLEKDASETVIEYHAERILKEAEKKRAFRRALKVSGLFTQEERLQINQEQKNRWAEAFDQPIE